MNAASQAHYARQQPGVSSAISPYVCDRLARRNELSYDIAHGVMLHSFLEQSQFDAQPGVDRVHTPFEEIHLHPFPANAGPRSATTAITN
jgi:hypothetical protein